jgi:hypothetical protein
MRNVILAASTTFCDDAATQPIICCVDPCLWSHQTKLNLQRNARDDKEDAMELQDDHGLGQADWDDMWTPQMRIMSPSLIAPRLRRVYAGNLVLGKGSGCKTGHTEAARANTHSARARARHGAEEFDGSALLQSS